MTTRLFVMAQVIVGLGCLLLTGTVVSGSDLPPERISIIRLIADPESFHGKRVVTRGYLVIRLEGNALYLSKTDADMGTTMNAVEVAIPRERLDEFAKFQGSYVSLEGVFMRNDESRANLYSGEIANVTRIFLVIKEGDQWRSGDPN